MKKNIKGSEFFWRVIDREVLNLVSETNDIFYRSDAVETKVLNRGIDSLANAFYIILTTWKFK